MVISRHDLHADDLPVEIITTDSSEAGANAFFAGGYSKKETLESGAAGYSNRTAVTEKTEEKKEVEPFVRMWRSSFFRKLQRLSRTL